jgi:hypothetical protein
MTITTTPKTVQVRKPVEIVVHVLGRQSNDARFLWVNVRRDPSSVPCQATVRLEEVVAPPVADGRLAQEVPVPTGSSTFRFRFTPLFGDRVYGVCAFLADDPASRSGNASAASGQFYVDAASSLPQLTTTNAKNYAAEAFARRFKEAFTRRTTPTQPVAGCVHVSSTRATCAAQWAKSPYTFGGSVTIWLAMKDSGVYWFYAYTIRRTDRACQRSGRSGCIRTFRVR